MVLQSRHKSVVGVREVVQLPGEFVLPLHTVKKVVPVTKDDDKDSRDPATGIIVAPIDDRSNERYLIIWPQMEMVEMVGESAVSEIALSEIS